MNEVEHTSKATNIAAMKCVHIKHLKYSGKHNNNFTKKYNYI